jgi:hypothetical protein
MLALPVMLTMAIASFAASSYAQQRLTRNQLAGTWTLVSCADAKGTSTNFCVNPNGRLMFDAGGRYMIMIAAKGRPKLQAGVPRSERSAEEYKSIGLGLLAQLGTWSFNEADQTVTYRIEAAFFPQGEGTDAKFSLSLTGDDLREVSDNGGVAIWRRAR